MNCPIISLAVLASNALEQINSFHLKTKEDDLRNLYIRTIMRPKLHIIITSIVIAGINGTNTSVIVVGTSLLRVAGMGLLASKGITVVIAITDTSESYCYLD